MRRVDDGTPYVRPHSYVSHTGHQMWPYRAYPLLCSHPEQQMWGRCSSYVPHTGQQMGLYTLTHSYVSHPETADVGVGPHRTACIPSQPPPVPLAVICTPVTYTPAPQVLNCTPVPLAVICTPVILPNQESMIRRFFNGCDSRLCIILSFTFQNKLSVTKNCTPVP